MTSPKTREFFELKIGDSFQSHGQNYRKKTDRSAILLRWATGDVPTVPSVHTFFPEVVVLESDEPAED